MKIKHNEDRTFTATDLSIEDVSAILIGLEHLKPIFTGVDGVKAKAFLQTAQQWRAELVAFASALAGIPAE